jgi:4-hydroxybenzoate polyprenyl transferase
MTVFLFLWGSVFMRSAGCVINDLADQSFDQKVARTKTRPLAAGVLNKYQALSFLMLLLGSAFLILLQLKKMTILMGFFFLPLVILYPFMKRWTFWPQLFLGLVFNGGILMAWVEGGGSFSLEPLMLYGVGIFWTLGYDTVYGYQDKEEDEMLGLKSTALLFKGQLKPFLLGCFSVMIFLLISIGLHNEYTKIYYGTLISLYGWFIYQVWFLNPSAKENLLVFFRNQKWVGFWVLGAILLGKI